MGLFDGKKGLILGVANDHSIAWHIAKTVMDKAACQAHQNAQRHESPNRLNQIANHRGICRFQVECETSEV